MRDPKRIPGVLKVVKHFWARNPDMRLGQLLWYIAGKDPFYIEDDDLIRHVKKLSVVEGDEAEEEYNCPIHGKLGSSECPRC